MAMELVVDETHAGTDERTWLASSCLAELPPLQITPPGRLVVVAPHPDDEVLGAGGLLQSMHHLGVELGVIAVTDGEGSHPVAHSSGVDIASTRALESAIALDRLGCGRVPVTRLGLPDGEVASEISRLTEALADLLGPDDLCLTPWRSDGHPDHDATGAATLAAAAATGTPVLEYLVWAWHWASPDDVIVPWPNCLRFDLDPAQSARKRWATDAFTSQISRRDSELQQEPVLTDTVLQRFRRPFEVFIEAGG
jgi:LmbE family N-acetylglucosaminyl deacetylase